ncbi:MAG: ferric reductase-like transmembrane domain-containing protein [Chloroflexi bacterium]|nr:ferric reductase-like transmembrane domain-containing protein [Chloroflexota bacterium]
MRQSQLGNLTITALVVINVTLWIIFPPLHNGKELFVNQYISEVLSTSALILFACGIILSLRLRIFETFFGGLDRMYSTHKSIALLGISMIFAHFLLMPLTSDTPWGNRLGMTAMIGMTILILLTLAHRIPFFGTMVRLAYHNWKITHKFVGLFFIIGMIHAVNVNNIVQTSDIVNWYGKIIYYIGAAAYLYKELLAPLLQKPYAYVVEKVRKLNLSTLEVTLKPKNEKAKQVAGQFTFVSFKEDKVLGEQHPFTVSSSPKEDSLRLSIKASGDWTKHLYENLKEGSEARVEGCYGKMNYKDGGAEQIWIAGGIGVTPFLSWVRDLDNLDREIHFYYTVRAENDALFWDEFNAAAQKHSRFRATLNVSAKDGSLTADKIVANIKGDIKGKHFYMCGPAPMTEAFQKKFIGLGVAESQIHFEEFNFR